MIGRLAGTGSSTSASSRRSTRRSANSGSSRSTGSLSLTLRIELRLAGDYPRIAIRERLPEHAELEAVVARLARIDAGARRPGRHATCSSSPTSPASFRACSRRR